MKVIPVVIIVCTHVPQQLFNRVVHDKVAHRLTRDTHVKLYSMTKESDKLCYEFADTFDCEDALAC